MKKKQNRQIYLVHLVHTFVTDSFSAYYKDKEVILKYYGY